MKKEDDDGLVEIKDYPGTKIVDLIVYPLTGAEGIHLEKAKLKMSGFDLDREWVALERNFDVDTPYAKEKRFIVLSKNEAIGEVKTRIEEKEGNRYLEFT